jgi:hypothetical protein
MIPKSGSRFSDKIMHRSRVPAYLAGFDSTALQFPDRSIFPTSSARRSDMGCASSYRSLSRRPISPRTCALWKALPRDNRIVFLRMGFQTCKILNTLYNIEHPGWCFVPPRTMRFALACRDKARYVSKDVPRLCLRFPRPMRFWFSQRPAGIKIKQQFGTVSASDRQPRFEN